MERSLTLTEKILTVSFKVIAWGFLLLFVCGLCTSLYISSQPKYIVYEERELIQVNNKSEIEGSFFLASGSFGEELYYQFYYKDKNNFIVYNKVPVESEKIKIRFSDRPKLLIVNKGNKYGWEEQGMILEVPESAILRDYNLNLK